MDNLLTERSTDKANIRKKTEQGMSGDMNKTKDQDWELFIMMIILSPTQDS